MPTSQELPHPDITDVALTDVLFALSDPARLQIVRDLADGPLEMAQCGATNPDVSGPSPQGTLPATGSVAALISAATGHQPYYVGKPNPLMMRSALNRIDAHSESTVMIGDRMDTDVVSGLEAGLRTILVLTGSTRREQVQRFPYQPTRVVDSIADIVPLVAELRPLTGPSSD
jgi:NagD protein